MEDTVANEGAAGESLSLIDRAQPAVLEMRELLGITSADSSDVSDTDAKLNTALHRAVLSICGNGNNPAISYRQLDKLIMSQNKKLNMPNKEGYTAIGLAVEYSNKKCVKHMLKHPRKYLLYLDYYPGDREYTVREIIVEIYPELQSLLPVPLTESLESSNVDKKLLAALQQNKYEVFLKYLSQINPNPWYNEPYHSSLLQIACQMKKRNRFIKLLIDSGADPNIKNRVTGMPLLHATTRSGNFELLEILLKKEEIDISLKDYKDRTILHWLAQVRERKPSDKSIMEKCFKLLLDIPSIKKMGVDFRDVSENTPLYIALEKKFRDRAKLLLSAGANVGILGNACTVLLPTTLPILTEIIEDCLESNDELIASKDIEIRLNYQLLMNIVPPIAESRHLRDLLKHPVISTFLNLKWQHFKFIVVLNMVFYVLFLIVLTAYILIDGSVGSNTTNPFSFNDSHMNDSNFISQREEP